MKINKDRYRAMLLVCHWAATLVDEEGNPLCHDPVDPTICKLSASVADLRKYGGRKLTKMLHVKHYG